MKTFTKIDLINLSNAIALLALISFVTKDKQDRQASKIKARALKLGIPAKCYYKIEMRAYNLACMNESAYLQVQ